MARISKPPEERREEIIMAARTLFCDKGFDKTMITDIAQEINVAQGLVYHYFKSKNEILYAVIQQLGDEFALSIGDQAKELDCENAFHTLSTLILKRLVNMQTFIDYIKLEQSLESDRSLVEYIRSKIILSVSPIIENIIETGVGDGSICCPAPREYAKFLLSGLSGLYMPDEEDTLHESLIQGMIERILGTSEPSEE